MDRASVVALAFEHFQANQLVEANQLVSELLTSDPDDPVALDLCALVALSRRDLGLALTQSARAASLANEARFHCNYGVVLGHAGQHRAAAEAYARALALDANYPEAHNSRGVALSRIGQNEDAEHAYRSALERRPDYVEAWMGLGDVLQSQNRLLEAISAYERGTTLDPKWPRSSLGQAQRRIGRRAAALATYRADAAARPDDPDALNNLAAALSDAHNEGVTEASDGWTERLRRHRERLLEAVGCCERAIALRPESLRLTAILVTFSAT